MNTRQDYLSGKCTHEEYYSQFAPIFNYAVRSKWDKEYLREKLKEDKHLNNIPLHYWDVMSKQYKAQIAYRNMRINGDKTWSLSDGVCAAKQAAKEIADEKDTEGTF